jgi:nitrous-oxide reductase
MKKLNIKLITLIMVILLMTMNGCKPKNAGSAVSGDAAQKAYVAPGKV